MEVLFASEVAAVVGHRLGRAVSPREVTDLFYRKKVPDELGPVVGGRRVIKVEAVDLITRLLAITPRPAEGAA
jgi:hypothetical protein